MQAKTLEDDDEGFRNKGTSILSGKIIKGTMHEAPIKLNVSSIPAKYENVIYRNSSRAAFGDSTKKFFKISANDSSLNPGPGCYDPNSTLSKIGSKKGSGFFASQTKLQRLERVRSHVPGPGSYKVTPLNRKPTSVTNHKTRNPKSQLNQSKSTAILSSRIQSRDLFKHEISSTINNPSVGAYELNPEKMAKSKSAYASFKSKFDRFAAKYQENPPVGCYEVASPVRSPKNVIKRIEVSTQESEAARQKKIKQAIKNLQQRQSKQKLGPGTYEPTLASTAKTFKIKQTIYDRFGHLKPIYQISQTISHDHLSEQPTRAHNFNPSKTYNSIFKSNTMRSDIKLANQMDPGVYNGSKSPPKKSHLINFQQKWV